MQTMRGRLQLHPGHVWCASSNQRTYSSVPWKLLIDCVFGGYCVELCGVQSATTFSVNSSSSRCRIDLIIIVWRLSCIERDRTLWYWHALCHLLTTLGWLGSLSDVSRLCMWCWTSSATLRVCQRRRRTGGQQTLLRGQRQLTICSLHWLQFTSNSNTFTRNSSGDEIPERDVFLYTTTW